MFDSLVSCLLTTLHEEKQCYAPKRTGNDQRGKGEEVSPCGGKNRPESHLLQVHKMNFPQSVESKYGPCAESCVVVLWL